VQPRAIKHKRKRKYSEALTLSLGESLLQQEHRYLHNLGIKKPSLAGEGWVTAIKLRKKEFILISPPPTPSIKRGLKSKKKSPLNRLT